MKLKRWEWLIIIIVIFTLFGIAWALDETITVSYTPIGLTSTKYLIHRNALIYVEGNAIRFTLDGVAVPTSGGIGIKLDVGQNLNLITRGQISKFKAVRDSATANATLQVTYWD